MNSFNNLYFVNPSRNPEIAESSPSGGFCQTPIEVPHQQNNVPIIKYIAFMGGGGKNVSLLGTLKYLNDKKLLNNIKVSSGASMGAVVACVLAFGCDIEEAKTKFIAESATISTMPLTLWELIFLVPNLLINFGIKGKDILKKIADNVFELGKIPKDTTFEELYRMKGIDLIIAITNVSRNITEYCNYENTPKRKIYDMLIVSCSVPFIFQTTMIDNEYFCDGGMYSDLPVAIIKRNYGEEEYYNYGLSVYSDAKKYASYSPINSILDYGYYLSINAIVSASSKELVKYGAIDGNYKYLDRNLIVILTSTEISQLKFSYTADEVITLIKGGYDATKNYFDLNYNML